MNAPFKPMLASDAVLEKLSFPLLASPKLDGIRAVVRNGVVYSRSNKPIPNKFVQEKFKHLEHHDGELIVGPATAHDVYRQTTSHVMAHDKEDFAVQFFAFDHIRDLNAPYGLRAKEIEARPGLVKHEHRLIKTLDALLTYEEQCLETGYEGLILRDPDGYYKTGRSTVSEGLLLKLKRFLDDEAHVVGFAEQMHNANEATTNELGRTKRSSHKANKHGKDTLGALQVLWKGLEFEIGTGMTDAVRKHIWENRDDFIGKLVKFKYFPVGIKDKPRHPVFLGWRDRSDI